MTTYTVPSGTFVYSNTLAAGTADLVEFADRVGYATVTNTGASVMYARADGQTATEAGEGCLAVMPGGQAVLANGEPLWYQSSKVIPQGANQFGGGNTSQHPGAPGEVTPMESLAGQLANPGSVVSIISSAAETYTIAFAG
ncbi:MAG: hypothetical protein ACRDRJ_05070 [Streptosporangiaceae bacterium]